MTITAETRLLGLLGWPVAHSLSPAMHNAAAVALQLDVAYLPLPVMPQRIEAALHGLVALGFLGANVTVPHKQAVMPFLETIEPAARAIGAVNTILIERKESSVAASRSPIPNLHGFNTDWSGFLADLQENDIFVNERECLVLGAGGSARAVAYALARAGGRVTVYARRPAQAEELVIDLEEYLDEPALRAAPWKQLAEIEAAGAPLIVNTTPVGMHPRQDVSPWPDELPFPPGSVVYDLIYNPQETCFMQQARASGCRAVNGLGMLLQQGALAFEIWTGVKPPLDVMAAALGGGDTGQGT